VLIAHVASLTVSTRTLKVRSVKLPSRSNFHAPKPAVSSVQISRLLIVAFSIVRLALGLPDVAAAPPNARPTQRKHG
jgi:hypothetical protein